MEIRWVGLRKTPRNHAAADLAVSAGGVAVEYRVYLRNTVYLTFRSVDRSRLAARPLTGVGIEAKKVGGGDGWYVYATAGMLAAGRKKLRDALAENVWTAAESGCANEKKAKGWLEKLDAAPLCGIVYGYRSCKCQRASTRKHKTPPLAAYVGRTNPKILLMWP